MAGTSRWSGGRNVAAAALCLITLAACGGASGSAGPAEQSKSLVAANFGGVTGAALKTSLEDPFAKETGVGFQQVNVGSGFAAKLQAQSQSGNISWDVIEGLSGPDAALLHQQGLLEPLPRELKTKLEDISIPGAVTDFGVSLADTGYVIACNKETVSACPKNPAEFWDVKSFPGRRALPNIPAAMLATALVADGVPAADVFPIDTNRALASMKKVSADVDVWTTSGDQQMQVMRDRQVDMSIMWNGRAKALLDQKMALQLEWEGSLVNPNYLVVVKGSPNAALGMKYLEWYATRPEVQSELAKRLAYGMSHAKTADYLTEAEANVLPAAHAQDNQVRLDPSWWVDNGKSVEGPWRELVGG